MSPSFIIIIICLRKPPENRFLLRQRRNNSLLFRVQKIAVTSANIWQKRKARRNPPRRRSTSPCHQIDGLSGTRIFSAARKKHQSHFSRFCYVIDFVSSGCCVFGPENLFRSNWVINSRLCLSISPTLSCSRNRCRRINLHPTQRLLLLLLLLLARKSHLFTSCRIIRSSRYKPPQWVTMGRQDPRVCAIRKKRFVFEKQCAAASSVVTFVFYDLWQGPLYLPDFATSASLRRRRRTPVITCPSCTIATKLFDTQSVVNWNWLPPITHSSSASTIKLEQPPESLHFLETVSGW